MGKGYCNCRSTKTKSRTIIIPDIKLDEEKWCPGCEQFITIKDFYGDTTRSKGISCYCKVCDNKKRCSRSIKNKEQNEKS